jgi:transcriptional regulator with XRE-family HTH domain
MLKPTAGSQVQHARFAQGITLRDLAEKANVTQKTILDFEKGRTNPHGHTVYRIADALGLDPEQLFETEVAS